jgi:prepilin-type processing-associated H-X9-DG protein
LVLGWVVGLILLVVVGLVIYPVFARARAKAGMNNCLSNVKQLTLGLVMYASDNQDHFPPVQNWAGGVFPYVKNVQTYVCPDDLSPRRYAGEIQEQSYTMNLAANELSLAAIGDPATLGVIFDGNAPYGLRESVVFRHHGGAYVGFADGHVKWLPRAAFTSEVLMPLGLRVTPPAATR